MNDSVTRKLVTKRYCNAPQISINSPPLSINFQMEGSSEVSRFHRLISSLDPLSYFRRVYQQVLTSRVSGSVSCASAAVARQNRIEGGAAENLSRFSAFLAPPRIEPMPQQQICVYFPLETLWKVGLKNASNTYFYEEIAYLAWDFLELKSRKKIYFGLCLCHQKSQLAMIRTPTTASSSHLNNIT